MSDSPLLACVVAIELNSAVPAARRCLAPADAGQLAAHVMADLTERLPQVDRCGLALAGALYDATELLRPDWRVFERLSRHYAQGVGADTPPRLLALGAKEGRMPEAALQPDPERSGAPLVFLPFVLMAPDDLVTDLAPVLESLLVASGQLGAASALGVQSLFGLRLHHAQYLTRYDLCALMAAQLDPLGLAPLWSLLETGLLTPGDAQRVEDGHGGVWVWRGGRVESGFTGYGDWLEGEAGQAALSEGRVGEAFADALLVQRQYLALLQAHGVTVHWPGDRIDALVEVMAPGEPDAVRAVRLPQLGLAARIATCGDCIVRIGYPFSTDGAHELASAFDHLTEGEALRHWPVDPSSGRLTL